MIKGAIFDMDGTLLDSMPVWDHISEQYLSRHGVSITQADYEAIEGGTQLGVARYFTNTYPQIAISAEQIVKEMNELITQRYERIAKMKPGVLEFLERLQKNGVRCAIATLTDRHHAEKALRDRDMMRYFEFMLTIEDVGVSKREPAIYLRAAERLGGTPEECMVFEDAPYAAETARKAGFQVCGMVEKAYASGEALLRSSSHLVVEQSFDELQKVLFAS